VSTYHGKIKPSLISAWWWRVDRAMLFAIFCIIVFGLVLVMAASPGVARTIGVDSTHFIYRQIFFLGLGIGVMLSVSAVPIIYIRRFAPIGFLAAVALVVYVIAFGQEVKGAKLWIHLGGFTLQPSEFIKPFFMVLNGWVLARRNLESNFPGFTISAAMFLIVSGLLVMQNDFGMTLTIAAAWSVQIFLAGLSFLWISLAALAGGGAVAAAYFLKPHVAARINSFFDPESGDNYQVGKSLEAFMNGGILGRGPGQGVVKERIPDAHTDFIFAVAGEELGMIACLILVSIFAFIVARGFHKVSKENDLFILLATCGLLMVFAFQAFVNMGVALNILPNTGITLPFVSYGGSSTIAISITAGMILALTSKRYGLRQ
jgi:cell division protein FtsW